MKTVLVLAALVGLALAGTVPEHYDFETKTVDAEYVARQKKVFDLLKHITVVDYNTEYYKIGKDYDIEANLEHYTNKKAVEEFLLYFRHGMLPRYQVFSVFYERMQEEAITLYHLFYYAKDFETFYKTACWARVYLNEGMFTYSFSIAMMHRSDTKGLILPAPYEIYPYFFVNSDVIGKMYRIKMMEGKIDEKLASYYGITKQDQVFTVYANYSSYQTYDNEDQRLSYFTEDIGMNTYYYYFHTAMPFWMSGNEFGFIKERRGEFYFHFHQQLLARYYMERLTNGLGEIPEFSWRFPIKTGYEPNMIYHTMMPFVQRDDYYHVQTPKNVEHLEFVESFETQFFEYLQQGFFNGFNTEVDLKQDKAVNFVGNFWQSNPDLYEKVGKKHYQQYYEILARVLLGAAVEPKDKHIAAPVALEQFQTALRDPAFYQLYKRIIYYFLQYKQYLEPYSRESLHFTGVRIDEVKVDRLVTYFDFFDFDGNNAVCYSNEEYTKLPYYFNIRQPRLAHQPFNVNIEIFNADVATDAIVKMFIAPKYDSNGLPISLEDNWMNFYGVDYFKYTLVQGKNTIVRKSDDFLGFKDDSVPSWKIMQMLDTGKVPKDMSESFFYMPRRMMLPKGTKGGFPLQFFVIVYPYTADKNAEAIQAYLLDNKPFGYPFDRPLNELYFHQSNMYFEDVSIYHKGEDYFYKYNIPGYKFTENDVPK